MNFLHISKPQKAYTIIFLISLFSAFYNAFLPLHGDEAYYWVWSKHLQAGYFDHPPMIAILIRIATYISDAEWGIRLVNVFSMGISAIYIFKLAKEMFDEDVAYKTILIFCSVILVHAGYILTTTDAPLVLFWSILLYYAYLALYKEKMLYYIISGVMLGCAMLSKYTSILFVASLIMFILLKKRDVFKHKGFYVAIIISLLIISPMLWWNYKHDWISFAFQLTYRGAKDSSLHPNLFFEFLGGQFGIFSPVFTAILFYYLIKKRLFIKNEKLFFLALNSSVVLLFFLYKSLHTRMELNFAAPAYIAGAILSGYIFKAYNLEKLFKIGLIIAICFTVLGRVLFLTQLHAIQDRMYGKREAVYEVQKLAKKGDAFYGDHLTLAAYLQYYLKEHPHTDVLTHTRFSQYDMWRKKDYLKDGLVLAKSDETDELKQLYKKVKLLKTIYIKIGFGKKKTNIMYIYRVENPRK